MYTHKKQKYIKKIYKLLDESNKTKTRHNTELYGGNQINNNNKKLIDYIYGLTYREMRYNPTIDDPIIKEFLDLSIKFDRDIVIGLTIMNSPSVYDYIKKEINWIKICQKVTVHASINIEEGVGHIHIFVMGREGITYDAWRSILANTYGIYAELRNHKNVEQFGLGKIIYVHIIEPEQRILTNFDEYIAGLKKILNNESTPATQI